MSENTCLYNYNQVRAMSDVMSSSNVSFIQIEKS